jgi:hypothetical protein
MNEHRDFRRFERVGVVLAALVVFAAVLACKAPTPPEATVVCTGGSEDVSCVVTHVAGSVGVNACWDLQFDCANGTVVKGSGFCQSVQPKATETKKIPLKDLSNADKCDKATGAKVDNLKLTAL